MLQQPHTLALVMRGPPQCMPMRMPQILAAVLLTVILTPFRQAPGGVITTCLNPFMTRLANSHSHASLQAIHLQQCADEVHTQCGDLTSGCPIITTQQANNQCWRRLDTAVHLAKETGCPTDAHRLHARRCPSASASIRVYLAKQYARSNPVLSGHYPSSSSGPIVAGPLCVLPVDAAGPQAGAARPSERSEAMRLAISIAVMAASPPLLPTLPPARSSACM
jgi:hypothetical protein